MEEKGEDMRRSHQTPALLTLGRMEYHNSKALQHSSPLMRKACSGKETATSCPYCSAWLSCAALTEV